VYDTAAAVAATTLTTSSTVTHNGGTANGVAYLNGSKVLTTGSALVFDGTNLGIGTASPNYPATIYKATFPTLQFVNSASGSTASDGLLIYLNGKALKMNPLKKCWLRQTITAFRS
jgi:hypothetical protein